MCRISLTHDGNRLATTTDAAYKTTTYALDFFYDANGTPFAVKYNGDMRYYITNLQGDVISIVDSGGAVVASYEYAPYGNIVSATGYMAEINPLRYRGYVYDSETEMYYLQSRYYDPRMGRFINADAYASTGQGVLGNNMFAYCVNNPILYVDMDGCSPMQSQFAYATIGDGSGSSYAMIQYMELKAAYEAAGITLHYTADDALKTWIDEYLPLSKECEYTTLLYCIKTTMGLRYHTSRTIRGAKNNVILGTIAFAIENQLSAATLIAHVHTHPDPGAGYHNDFPSLLSDGLGGDQLAYYLFGFPEMYIIPYKRCSGTPIVMVYSDKSTWCEGYLSS